MKKVLLLAACSLFFTHVIAQSRHVRAYCDRQCGTAKTQIHIPGFLLRFCAGDPELKPFVRKMHSLKILHLEKSGKASGSSNGLNDALQADGYDEMLSVKEGGEQFGIYITGNEERIKSILLAVDSKEELVLLSAKVNMTMDQLSKMLEGPGRQQLKGLVSMNK